MNPLNPAHPAELEMGNDHSDDKVEVNSYLYPCDHCGNLVDRTTLVDQMVYNAHTFDVVQYSRLCEACAQEDERRRTYGPSEAWALEAIKDGLARQYGAPMDVRWLQGDVHKILVHARVPNDQVNPDHEVR
jgi:hypothetical protein